jgi:hypothetical protein
MVGLPTVVVTVVSGFMVAGLTGLAGLNVLTSWLVAMGWARLIIPNWARFVAWDEHVSGHHP